MDKTSILLVVMASGIFSVLLSSVTINEEISAWNPASLKLLDRATELDLESEQAKNDGNDVKAFTKSYAAQKLREFS